VAGTRSAGGKLARPAVCRTGPGCDGRVGLAVAGCSFDVHTCTCPRYRGLALQLDPAAQLGQRFCDCFELPTRSQQNWRTDNWPPLRWRLSPNRLRFQPIPLIKFSRSGCGLRQLCVRPRDAKRMGRTSATKWLPTPPRAPWPSVRHFIGIAARPTIDVAEALSGH